MSTKGAPKRDIDIVEQPAVAPAPAVPTVSAPATAPAEAPADVTEPEAEAKTTRKNWTEFKGVVESTKIETVDRLDIVVGVNQYKGNHFVFVAKITEEGFQRAFFGMPAYVWNKALPVLTGYAGRIGEIEKQAMAKAVIDELKRLKELGIDIKGLVEQL